MIIDLLFLVPGILFLLVFGYLYFLAAAALWPGKQQELSPPKLRFAIIIPAHNESALIGQTLEKLQAIDYPQELYEAIVVADNCTDNTEDIVRRAGVTCLLRKDTINRGKGNVLKWVFPRLLAQDTHEAYVIIDADSHLERDFLRRINHHLCNGTKVVQGYSQVRHPERSPMESLAFLGFALNRNLRYRGRSRLGWTSNLLGTGMCFSREVIEKYGWNTTSMVEDIEYAMMLHLQGVRVLFADKARLSVELHKSVDQSQEQRTRWDMGKFTVRNTYLPRLLKEGIRRRDISYFDSAMELVLPPFSLLCVLVLSCCGLFVLLGYHGKNLNYYLYLTVFLGLTLYIGCGLITAKAKSKVYWSLIHAPFFIVWRFGIVVAEWLQGNTKRQW